MKSLVNYALFKEQLKRFWAIAVLSTLWYAFFVVMPLYSSISNNSRYAADSVVEVLSMRYPVVQIMLILIPFAAVLCSFSYLFQPKSTAAMHSWPFNKKQLYFTNIASGAVLIAIPLVFLCVFLLKPVFCIVPETRLGPDGVVQYMGYITSLPAQLFPNGLSNGTVINTFPIVAGFFFRALLTSMFYYSVFLLAVMAAGNAVVYVLLCGAIPLIPSALLLLGITTGSFYLFGFDSNELPFSLTRLLTYTNPVALGTAFTEWQETVTNVRSLLPYYAVYILIAVALFAVSYWCNGARKQERAGDSVVFVSLKNVLIFLLSMAGMVFLGAFILGIFGSVTLMYAGFVLGFAITYFIAQMIAEKTFNVLFKAKDIIKFGGVMVLLLAAVILAARFDISGYQSYTPQADEVEGVYLYPLYTIYNRMPEERSAENMRPYFVKDEKIIADTLALHKQITDSRLTLRSSFLRSLEKNAYENGISQQCVVFMLKNGKYVSRIYMLPEQFKQSSGLKELMMEESVILSQFSSFKNPGDLWRITLDYTFLGDDSELYDKTAYSESVFIDERDEIISVLEEIKKDIVITERERMKNPEKPLEKIRVSGYTDLIVRNSWRTSDNFSLDSHENVDNWLEARGMMPERRKTEK